MQNALMSYIKNYEKGGVSSYSAAGHQRAAELLCRPSAFGVFLFAGDKSNNQT